MRVIHVVLGPFVTAGFVPMDAYPTGSTDVRYSDTAPILITGSSDEAIGDAARFVEATGARVGARMILEEASGRIADQASASAIWIELDRDCGPVLDVLMKQVSYDVRDGRY